MNAAVARIEDGSGGSEQAARMKAAPRARPGGRSLSSEKAERIVEAMRRSVARRGTAGSTFDQVSREAGVSRGLLHYYFGTKEQLLVEAVRLECELRLALRSCNRELRKRSAHCPILRETRPRKPEDEQ